MSRSNKSYTPCNAITRMAGFVAALMVSILATGCDGGLFGTGDGTDANMDIVATDTGAPDGIATDPATESQDTSEESEADGTPEASTNDIPPEQVQSFSNTLPSGLNAQTAALPALKVINLSNVAVNAAAFDAESADIGVDAQPGTSSEWLSINIGESDIRLSSINEGVSFAAISPLNSADDSLTSIVVSGSIASFDSVDAASGSSGVSVLALDTRAAVSASGMAEVRLIRTAVPSANETDTQNSSPLPDQYLLTPDSNNGDGVELVITTATDGNAQIGSYQLAAPGDYTLSSNGEVPLSQPITLEADTVYTLVVTSEPQRPAFVEIDSRVPASD